MKDPKCICCDITLIGYITGCSYCPNCNSVFINILPSEKELNTYYTEYQTNYHGGGRVRGSKRRQQKYAKKYYSYIDRYCDGEKVMDIGSANNPLPNILNENDFKVTVVDFQKASNLNKNIQFIKSSAEKLSNIDEEYDLVSSFSVIEHTRYPAIALQNMVKLTKTSGKIIVFIPEIGEFFDNYALGTTSWFIPPEHLNLLSKKGLVKIMGEYNCKLIHDSRFELNWLRFILRYGIGFIEGVTGYFIFKLNIKVWNSIRQKRKSKYVGMRIFIFNKN